MLKRSCLIGLFLVITALKECHSQQQDICHFGVDPNIGQTRHYSWDENDDDSSSSDRKRSASTGSYCGMFLDTNAPSQCSGVCTSWSYCFYLSQYSSYSREAELALYRRKTEDSTEYTRVDESHITVTVYGIHLDRDYYCQAVNIPPFSVVEGDVIGVCMAENSSRRVLPLDVVAELPGGSVSYSNQQCIGDLSSVDVGGSGWSTVSDLALHVYLSIVPSVPTSSSAFTAHSTITPVSSTLFQSLLSLVPPSPTLLPEGTRTLSLNPSVMSDNVNRDNTSEPGLSQTEIIAIAAGAGGGVIALLVCGSVIAICCTCKACWQRKKMRKYVVDGNNNNHDNVGCEAQFVSAQCDNFEEIAEEKVYAEPACNVTGLFHQLEEDDILVIPREAIQTTVPLGQGRFTLVNRAIWHDAEGMISEVAVKCLTPGSPPQEQIGLLREAAMMIQFHHPNVIQLFGIVVHDEQVTLVTELARNGTLQNCLKSLHSVSSDMRELLSFSKDVALGMEYLTRKGFIHRNLNAQNVLLSSSKTCKIAGFGFSRSLKNEPYYVSTSTSDDPPQLKSAAPEAIAYKKYSIHGDVWSYGCLLYEIWSLGKQPFEELNDTEALERLASGYRHPPPSGCPTQIYELMSLCWHPDSYSRPDFHSIFMFLLHTEETLGLSDGTEEWCDQQPLELAGSSINLIDDVYDNID